MSALVESLRGPGGNRSLRSVSVGGNPGADTRAARALAGCAAVKFLRTAGAGEALRSVSDRGLGDDGAKVGRRRSTRPCYFLIFFLSKCVFFTRNPVTTPPRSFPLHAPEHTETVRVSGSHDV